jgi:hypothetical protein
MKYLLFFFVVYNFIFPLRLTFIPKSELLFFSVLFIHYLTNDLTKNI